MPRAIGIRVLKGGELVDTQIFERDIIKIGRLASAHLRLEDPKVSRIHAVIDIAQNGSEVSIIDMGSAEGTRVNGEKVSRVRLKHGDEVGLGDSRLVVLLDEDELAVLKAGAGGVDSTMTVNLPSNLQKAGDAEVVAAMPDLPETSGVFAGGGVSSLQQELAAGNIPVHSEMGQTTAVFQQPSHLQEPTAVNVPPPVQQPVRVAAPVAAVVAPVVAPVVAAAVAAPRPLPPPVSAPVVASPAPAAAPVAAAGAPREGRRGTAADRKPVDPNAPPRVPTGDRRVHPREGPMGALPPILPMQTNPMTPENRLVEVTLIWSGDPMEVRCFKTFKEGREITIGAAEGVEFFVPLEGTAASNKFVMLKHDKGGAWRVRWTGKMAGTLERNGQSVPLAQAGGQPDGEGYSMPLQDDMVLTITIGYFTLTVRNVARSRVPLIPPLFDVLWANTAVVTMFTTAALMAVALLVPVGLDTSEDDLLTNPGKFQTIIMKPPPKENSFLKNLKGAKKQTAAHKNDQGKAGDKKAKPTESGKMAIKAEKPSDEQVVASKLSALFGKDGAGGIQAILGDASGGGELEAALGGLDGAKVAAGYGQGGLGLRGGGPGGGGTGVNTMGIGKVGTKGRGAGDAAYGSGEGGLGGKADRDVSISQGTPIILGSLDPEIIRRIVREHQGQIRYCYERELTSHPGIFGKVVMKWVINGDGKVTQAQVAETQMKNSNVESCLASRIKGWVFPKPKGGGIVIVNYPFVFKQGG